MMTDEQFDSEVAAAAQGDWEALDLDTLPDGWQPASIEELRNAG